MSEPREWTMDPALPRRLRRLTTTLRTALDVAVTRPVGANRTTTKAALGFQDRVNIEQNDLLHGCSLTYCFARYWSGFGFMTCLHSCHQ